MKLIALWRGNGKMERTLPLSSQVVCHGIPDARELQSGDIINIDVTAIKNGYCGDLNEVNRMHAFA